MSSICKVICFCLILTAVFCTTARTEQSGFYVPPDSYGSQSILQALWPPEELAGNPPQDKRIRHLRQADLTPPQRENTTVSLQPLDDSLRGSIRSVRPQDHGKVLALTFDVCERSKEIAGYDAAIFNYLRANNVRATFFVGGKWLRSHPEKAQQIMADPLFEMGNHAWTHGNLRVLTGKRMREQIVWTQSQYELLWEQLAQRALKHGLPEQEMQRIPRLPLSFRFPYGTCSAEALETLAGLGLPAIQWNIVTGDPANVSAEKIAQAVLSEAKSGSIIICHANGRGRHTAAALPLFIPQLIKKGFAFVTISRLLRLGEAVRADSCYENRPGDNTRYDTLFGEGT